MADNSWGRPCSGKIQTLTRSDGLKLPVRTELLELILLLIDETEHLGYDIKPGQSWGYACRKIRGDSSSWSNHSWGLAVDLNAPENPMGPRTGKIRKFPKVIEVWKRYGFRWGGDYTGRADDMHMEFVGSVSDAAAHTARARTELARRPEPGPTEEDEMLEVIKVKGDTTGALWIKNGGLVWAATDPAGISELRASGDCKPKDREITPKAFSQLKRI